MAVESVVAKPDAAKPIAVIAGASGFVGPAIAQAFRDDGYEVRFIGRSAEITWSDPAGIAQLIDGSAIVVNLAGKSVNCRYNDKNRNEILRSRVETTRALREAIATASAPPAIWMNASTATIYRHSTDRPNSDDNGELGKGFSVDVARNWENEFFESDLPQTRRVALRMAIVLGDGPATNLLLRLARIGLGGPHIDGWWFGHNRYRGIGPTPTGSGRAEGHKTGGRQKFSWVHLDDVVRVIRFVRDTDTIAGAINVASPNPSDNRTLMGILRRAAGMPFGLPAWRWMLEPAMMVLRTEPELILKSRWVVPGTLTEAGFTFEHPDLADAIAEITGR
ncbi:cell-division inhibitor [marine actinobacterium PHSC20C1]|nr:cell-division inhibitor [marine actinobacterium PHSC20C1]